MAHRLTGKRTTIIPHSIQLRHAMNKHLPTADLPLISHKRNLRWVDRLLVQVAVLMVWADATRLIDAFQSARQTVVEMYPGRRRPGRHFSGFIETLLRATPRLLNVLKPALRQATIQAAGPLWRWRRWVPLVVDGTRIDCPRTAVNKKIFGNAGRNKTAPQQYLTAVFHLTTGVVWDWRRGGGRASERKHMRAMIASLPEDALLVGDAGFPGYELMCLLREAGADFLMRVGSNLTLLEGLDCTVRQHKDIVYLWPKTFQHGKRKGRPLRLRLVRLRVGGQTCCLLTTVMDRQAMSKRAARELYGLRWKAAEVTFRWLKQTMDRRKLRSAAPAQAQVELDWAMVGLWLLLLMAVDAQNQMDKTQVSLVGALRSVRRWMTARSRRPPAGGLRRALRTALLDGYRRRGSKAAHDWPHKKREKPPGSPKMRKATELEIKKAQTLWYAKAAA